MPTVFYSSKEYATLVAECSRLRGVVADLNAMRPHWAQGLTSDGIAAQAACVALNQIWECIGAKNQTEAMLILAAHFPAK